jgi:hypothetical protein
MKNPNAKYYKIPCKSQSLNPNAYRRNFKNPINTKSQKFGSIGSYLDLETLASARLVVLEFWICLVVLVHIGIWDFLRAMQIQREGGE